MAEHEEYKHCPLGKGLKQGKKEVPGLDKVLLIEGRQPFAANSQAAARVGMGMPTYLLIQQHCSPPGDGFLV